jgi:photosystem II stability/assembly factor-like uncharacterized protein
VFAPSDSGVFYLGTSETGLYRRDHGRWRQIKIPGTRSIFELGVSPDDPDHLLAGCDRGIFQSFDGGESWDVVRGTPAVQFSAIQFDPEDGNIIYIAGVPGVYASRDRGVSWQLINRGLVHTRVMKLALSLEGDLYAGSDGGGVFFKSKRSTAWMSRSQGLSMQQQGLSLAALDEGILYAGTSTAIYRSENAGKSWSEVGYLDARPVTALALPKQPARHVGTQAPGLIATSDAGHSWQAVSLVQSAPLMIAANSLGDIYRSRDGGYEWELVYKHDPKHFEAAIWRMDFSPLDANLALGAAGQAGLLRSQDAGLTWERVSGDLPNKPVPIVAWSPHTRGEAILWMAGEGICRTHDSGKSWEIAGLAFAQIPVLSLAYCPHEPGRIYAGSQQGDLFILDSGSAWQPDRKVHLTEGKMLALVFSPDDHQTMLAATSRGIFLSRDRATSWQPFNAGLIPDDPVVNTLLFSPHDPNRLFAGLQIGVFTGRLPET